MASAPPFNVTVNFNESVTLTGGSLQVNLNSGATVTIAPFSGVSASGSYVVVAGQNASDLDSGSLTLTAGATLRDAAGNNAILTLFQQVNRWRICVIL